MPLTRTLPRWARTSRAEPKYRILNLLFILSVWKRSIGLHETIWTLAASLHTTRSKILRLVSSSFQYNLLYCFIQSAGI
ncbi:hypothetical protein WAI453_006081 [Rhynchosporium graminicola]